MSWIDLVGFAASAMVLATFCMTQMLLLRLLAIMSNLLFGAYGYLDHLYPVLLLHLVLLPVNCVRLRECLSERPSRSGQLGHHVTGSPRRPSLTDPIGFKSRWVRANGRSAYRWLTALPTRR